MNYAKLFTRRADGRYCATVLVDGKRKYLYSRDPEDLYNKLETAKAPKPPAPVLFREVAEAWHDSASIRENTWTAYEAHYKKALERFGDVPVSDLTTPDFRVLLDEMARQGYAKNTIRNMRSVLSNIMSFAQNDRRYTRLVPANPAKGVEMPRSAAKQKARTAPEDAVVRKVLAGATKPFGLYALLLISSGMRRGEALGLRWENIDLDKGEMSVVQQVVFQNSRPVVTEPKTDAGVRTIPILADLRAALEAVPKSQRKGYLFHNGDPEQPLTQSVFVRRWNNYCRDMGFGEEVKVPVVRRKKKTYKTVFKHNLTPHVFRHGYATLLFEADVDEYTAKELLGHSDIDVTRAIYTHLRQKQKDKSLANLRLGS